jgi:hypothetical protein
MKKLLEALCIEMPPWSGLSCIGLHSFNTDQNGE